MELSEIQKIVNDFNKEKNINNTLEIRIIDLISEMGELSKELLKSTNYGITDFKTSEEWRGEIADILYSIICIANETGIDLEKSFKDVLVKYDKRFKDKGHIGSEN